MEPRCQICASPLGILRDFGSQPVCNRYHAAGKSPGPVFPLRLAQCPVDGLLQLAEPWPASEVRPRLPWITYREPEAHLDDMAEHIARLPGVTRDSLIAGLSYKDDPVLNRLQAKGFANTWSVAASELGIHEPGAGMETLQDRLTPELAQRMRTVRPAPAVFVVRHLLEHSASVSRALGALVAWGGPGVHLVLEVPDSAQTFADADVGTIWEEHVCYFTETTLRHAFAPLHLSLRGIRRYPYTLEDCLVAFVTNTPPDTMAERPAAEVADALDLGRRFRDRLGPLAERCRSELARLQRRGERAVIFGAGHRAVTFVNLLGLEGLLDCVIDDDPRKAGLHLPGSGLAIVPSSELVERRPSLCLLAASPDSEASIVSRNQAFEGTGGRFSSIYPRSPLAWSPLHASP